MTATGVIAEGILLLAPGFVFWKAAYFSGAQHPRLEWEWVVWSLLASVVLNGLSGVVWAMAALTILPPAGSLAVALTPFVLAVTLGLLVGRGWEAIKGSHQPRFQRIERRVRDSAWDLVLDEASERRADGKALYGLQVTIDEGGKSKSYYGAIDAFGYEGAGAERWLYLRNVSVWVPIEGHSEGGEYREMAQTRGLLVKADKALRLRVIDRPRRLPPSTLLSR